MEEGATNAEEFRKGVEGSEAPPAEPAAPRKRRPRKIAKADGPVVKAMGTMEVQTVELDGRTFVQRYVRCGRDCARCGVESEQFDPERPGHGPYWYRLVKNKQGRTVRRYVGKSLVTEGEVKL